MKKTFILLITMFLGFWLIFISLQNNVIYSNSLGLIAQNWQNENGDIKLIEKPFDELTNKNYIQWDGEHYFKIRNDGYDIEKAGGDYIFAFFPLFPLIWKISQLPPIGMLFLNYLFFSISIVILLSVFSEAKNYVQNTIISLCLPSLVIFFIPYTEACFMLFISLGIYGLFKNKYWIFFIGLLLASLTRPSYTFLVLSIISVEFFFFIEHKNIINSLKNTALKTLPLLLGTSIVSLLQYSQNSGSLFKFIEVQKYWKNILGVPHNIRDWSHEGFAINIGVIFIIFVPLLIVIIQFLYYQIKGIKLNFAFNYESNKDYLFLLSIIYVIGNVLFIILFRGGSLHCLFRFSISSPFFFILLYTSFDYIKNIPLNFRFFLIASFSLLSLFVLGLADYSTFWNFSDFGIFILIGTLSMWLFQDLNSSKFFKIGSYLLLAINIIWTAYLFNTYISNGWIFA